MGAITVTYNVIGGISNVAPVIDPAIGKIVGLVVTYTIPPSVAGEQAKSKSRDVWGLLTSTQQVTIQGFYTNVMGVLKTTEGF